MANIGILGGTFNPIHRGHLQIARAAFEQYGLDRILFMPAGLPPHKDIAQGVSAIQRYEMVKTAVAGEEAFCASDYEIRKGGKSYTYETLQELTRDHPKDTFYFIIGEDSLQSFSTWRNPAIICEHAQILAAVRQDLSDPDMERFYEEIRQCRELFGPGIHILKTENFPVSSTEIRQQIYENDQVKEWLPEGVYTYIMEHGLYKMEKETYDLEQIRKQVKEALTKERYRHTEGVMYTAGALAMRYLYPVSEAMAAGLLHDCAKCLSDEERLKICKKNDIPVSPVERKHPHLLHAKVGAHLAKEVYGIEDPAILHAISVHTTGCSGMSLLDKIIFVADYIEPGRFKAPRLADVRQSAFVDIDRCCGMILQDTVEYLSLDQESMDETTMEAFLYYKKFL